MENLTELFQRWCQSETIRRFGDVIKMDMKTTHFIQLPLQPSSLQWSAPLKPTPPSGCTTAS